MSAGRAVGWLAFAGAVVAVLLVVALGSGVVGVEEDCDAEDLAAREADCGYYDGSVWVLYPWVVPGVGGSPPRGVKPRPPAGVRSNPAPAKPPAAVPAKPPAAVPAKPPAVPPKPRP